MKRTALLIFLSLFVTYGWSQSMFIHFKNGQTTEFNSNNIEYVEFKETTDNTTVTSGAAVDLGLSVKWASQNIGTTSPEQFGDKFSWGETSAKSSFNRDNYAYFDSNTYSYIDIGTDIKGTSYDVAHVKWGNGWRLPTYDECKELIEKCSREWVSINGIYGYKFTGNNGNSIFFPVQDTNTHYWTSNLCDRNDCAYELVIITASVHFYGEVREKWSFVRPVCPK
jgi:hypothetical protein